MAATTIFLPSVRIQQGGCGLTRQARLFSEHLVSDDRQQRPVMTCDPQLAELADRRARGLARGNEFFGHVVTTVDAQTITINEWLRAEGYPLPSRYATMGNNVESLVRHRAPFSLPAQALEFLVSSPSHVRHILGQTEFFAAQKLFGAGYAQTEGRDEFFWVVLSSHEVQ